MLKDQIQKTEIDTRRIFQLYFYRNLFGPQYHSAILSHETLNKNTIQMLLNEPFSLDKDTNVGIFKEYIVNKNIEFG